MPSFANSFVMTDSNGVGYWTLGHPPRPQKDFICSLYFFRILNTDTLQLKALYFPRKDSLINLIKMPEIAKRAGISGYIAIEFALDSSGIASNFRVIAGLGAGIEESIIEAMNNV